jgi:crotonobetainyl-CoA:carnitine CoA-transferase CaiB-like acyl-CoA transferase
MRTVVSLGSANGALAGRRVLDLADASGAYCGKLFADIGADVIKVEPPGGDPSRSTAPLWADAPPGESVGLPFLYRNTSKRSITLDLEVAAGREHFLALASAVDIVLETFAPGELDARGLGYAALRDVNPRIVLTSITGFGQSGPHREFKSSDLIASAMGGALYVTGEAEDPPVNLAGAQAYTMASTCAAASSMIALLHAERTGRGQHVDISIQEVVAAVCHIAGTGKWLDDGIVPRRMGSGLFASIPSGAYPCRDGLIYVMVNRPAHWQALARWIREETGEEAVLDPMFDGPSANRFPHRDLVDHFVGELTRRHTVADLYREGQARHLSFTPVNRVAAVVADPHLAARGFFVDVPHAAAKTLRYPGPPYRFSRTPARVRHAAPAAGADTKAVLAEGTRRTASPARTAVGDPLAEVRVVEFTAGMAGPWIGRFMAYHGADVIKVESAARPDVTRQYVEPRRPELGVQSQRSPWLTDWNAGKRCVALDLTKPDAVALALRLVEKADVVIENYATGVMEKLGLSYDALQRANPGLVMLSTTGFGDSGPCSRYVTWGPNIEATSGMSALTGFSHRPCTMTQYAYPDSLSALHGLFAVLAALDHKRRTGVGQFVNVAQLEATISVIGEVVMEATANGAEPPKLGNASRVAAPHGCYRCAGDDRWVAIAVFDDTAWRALCRVTGEPVLGAERRFATIAGRIDAGVELDARIEAWTVSRDAYEVMALLQAAGVAAGVVQTAQDKVERDAHLRARGFHETIAHEVKGEVVADGIPTGLTGTPGRTRFAGRAIGADNEAVFMGLLGQSREEFARCLAAGAIEASR